MSVETRPVVRRVRNARISTNEEDLHPSQSTYRGFGSVPGETLEDFHERMYEIDPLEAMIYEMEVTLNS